MLQHLLRPEEVRLRNHRLEGLRGDQKGGLTEARRADQMGGRLEDRRVARRADQKGGLTEALRADQMGGHRAGLMEAL